MAAVFSFVVKTAQKNLCFFCKDATELRVPRVVAYMLRVNACSCIGPVLVVVGSSGGGSGEGGVVYWFMLCWRYGVDVSGRGVI
jgi:hypothetical protein